MSSSHFCGYARCARTAPAASCPPRAASLPRRRTRWRRAVATSPPWKSFFSNSGAESNEGALKVDNVARAEGERKKCEEATVVARHNLAVAMKNRTKIDEHKEVWISMEAAEEEHRAEGELEDFVVRKPEI